MTDILKDELLELNKKIENHNDESLKTYIDLLIEKTTDTLIEEITKKLENEFREGTLKHTFIVSPEYYLELRLKEAKQNFSRRIQG